MEVTMELRLPVKIEKKNYQYVSSCPILDVYSQGDTFDAAKHNIVEALVAFFTGCLELGTLDAVLKKCGFRPDDAPRLARKPKSSLVEEYVSVPIHLLAEQTDPDQCHA